MKEKNLTKYSISYHALEEKEKILKGLLAAMDARYEKELFGDGVSPDNIVVMPDYSVRLADVANGSSRAEESGGNRAEEGLGGIPVARGFYNADENPKQTIWSKDLFGLAMCILYLYMGTDICFCSDESKGRDSRPVVDKVMEQMALAVEERKLPREIRSIVYSLLLKSSQRIEEKPVFSPLSDGELPFPATKRWNISLENTDEVCRSFLQGLYEEAKTNLHKGCKRLWNSTEHGKQGNALNIWHGAAGIAGVLLELEKVEEFKDISHEILKLTDAYLRAADAFRIQEDSPLLSGNYGVAWFLYIFYRRRGDGEKTEAAVNFALSLSGKSGQQDDATGLAEYGCTCLKFWKETGNTAFLDKARAAADSICASFVKRADKQAGVLYFMQMMRAATDEPAYHDYIATRLPALLEKVEAEINCYRQKKKADLSWCGGLAGIGTALLAIERQEKRRDIYLLLGDIAKIITASMWEQPNSLCHGNAGSVEFLMDMFDVTRDGTFLYQAKTIAKYIYTQRFYDSQGHVRFTDETKRSACYDYGTGATGAMRAILRAEGWVRGRIYLT